jgi:hypothetical protein
MSEPGFSGLKDYHDEEIFKSQLTNIPHEEFTNG